MIDKLFNDLISGTITGLGFTKFVEPIPNRNDSTSLLLNDNSLAPTRPANNPSPGKWVVFGLPNEVYVL